MSWPEPMTGEVGWPEPKLREYDQNIENIMIKRLELGTSWIEDGEKFCEADLELSQPQSQSQAGPDSLVGPAGKLEIRISSLALQEAGQTDAKLTSEAKMETKSYKPDKSAKNDENSKIDHLPDENGTILTKITNTYGNRTLNIFLITVQ